MSIIWLSHVWEKHLLLTGVPLSSPFHCHFLCRFPPHYTTMTSPVKLVTFLTISLSFSACNGVLLGLFFTLLSSPFPCHFPSIRYAACAHFPPHYTTMTSPVKLVKFLTISLSFSACDGVLLGLFFTLHYPPHFIVISIPFVTLLVLIFLPISLPFSACFGILLALSSSSLPSHFTVSKSCRS